VSPEDMQRFEVVHLIADGRATTSCCGRTPFELPHAHRLTVDPEQATCVQRAGEHTEVCP
jgi:hypothetical protein